MTSQPTPTKIKAALANTQQRPYTTGSRIKAAVEHAKASRAYCAAVKLAQVLQSVQP